MNRPGRRTLGWVCLLLVLALAAYALQAGVSAAVRSESAGDATGERWLASLAGPGAGDTVVGASGAVGYATPPARPGPAELTTTTSGR